MSGRNRTSAERKTYYSQRREKGLCGRCGRIPEIGNALCPDCQSYVREQNSRRAETARATGLCATCKRSPSKPGSGLCPKCSLAHQRKRIERKQQGICDRCHVNFSGGACYCTPCGKEMNARKRRLRAERNKEGLCSELGCNATAAQGLARCENHIFQKRLYRFGLSETDFNAMLQRQNGRCAICGRDEQLVIDHEHNAVGRVRGLLCTACNTGLGHFGDDPERLIRAASYLTNGEEVEVFELAS